jgi:hypothetical protein
LVVWFLFVSIKNTFVCVGKTGQLSSENVSLQSEVKSQRELIEQLELDVSSLQNLSSLNRGEAEVFNIFFLFYFPTDSIITTARKKDPVLSSYKTGLCCSFFFFIKAAFVLSKCLV